MTRGVPPAAAPGWPGGSGVFPDSGVTSGVPLRDTPPAGPGGGVSRFSCNAREPGRTLADVIAQPVGPAPILLLILLGEGAGAVVALLLWLTGFALLAAFFAVAAGAVIGLALAVRLNLRAPSPPLDINSQETGM